MQRIATTVLAVVGAPPPPDLRALAGELGEAANVRAAIPDADAPALERAVEAWREATRAHIPYLVHDADPLAEVAAAWVELWDATTPGPGATAVRGRLEVAVAAVVQRWRARSLELPDYYLVVDAEGLPVTARHWYLGVLADAAPHRVGLVGGGSAEVARTVRGLRAGWWWPDLDRLLRDIDRRVPDAVHAEEGGAGPSARTPSTELIV